MAAGWPRYFAGDQVEVCSAGSEPAVRINPDAVEAMREVGIDVTGQIPNRVECEAAQDFDVVITMGCGDFSGLSRKRYEDGQLDDSACEGVEAVRPIEDGIRARIEILLVGLVPATRPS